MATPRKIDEFLAWRMFNFCYGQLKSIRQAHGYNTDPFVTDNYTEYKNSGSKFALLIEVESHDTYDKGVGGGNNIPLIFQALTCVVTGSVQLGRDRPRKVAFQLEQDVRTAIHSGLQDMNATIGRAADFEFGACPHDAGELTPDNEAGFRLSFRLGYPQGKTW